MKLPNWLKSGLSSAALTFTVLFFPGLLGWLNSVYEWASSSGAKPLPGLSTLGYAAAAAAVSALAGVVMAAFRWAQGRFKLVPGQPPVFPGKEG